MKTFFLSLTAVLLLWSGTSTSVSAGKPFEGVLTYKISYPGTNLSESQMAMFPKIMTIMIKGTKARADLQTPMGTQMTIFDYTEKTKIALINMMGQKFAIQETADDILKQVAEAPVPKVTFSDETTTIAGNPCKKAIVTVDDKGSITTYDVWYTDAFGAQEANFDNPLFKDIPGVLMEFTVKQDQLTMQFTAISVEKKKIQSGEFDVPADYTLTTLEEFQSKMGGMQ